MPTLSVSLTGLADPAALEAEWRGLEARADPSFFQSWLWVGLVASRLRDPVLLRAVAGEATVALAVLGRRRRSFETLFLGESGEAALDDVFVEHNGILLDRAAPPGTLVACLRALLHSPIPGRGSGLARRLVLGGVGAPTLDALAPQGLGAPDHQAGSVVAIDRERASPRVEFGWLGSDYLDALSANTRHQLRRSARRYAERGALRVERAASVAQAEGFFDALRALHQRTWTRRGRPGAFANPAFVAFHRALIARGVARDEIDLLRIGAGGHDIGYLYNFVQGGRVAAYQSGFNYEAGRSHEKPGLTSHHLAIEHYRRAGAVSYDFLAGDDRYKRNLANATSRLFWLTVLRRGSLAAHAQRLETAARRIMGDIKTRFAVNGGVSPIPHDPSATRDHSP